MDAMRRGAWAATLILVQAGQVWAQAPDLTDTALIASGYETESAKARARAQLEAATVSLVHRLGTQGSAENRAKALLLALHEKGGLLGQYDPRATSLREILETRRFNCLSASVLYNLVARQMGLDVVAELLPTHARSLLAVEDAGQVRRVIVETTSPSGFDPPPDEQRRILLAVAGDDNSGRALVSREGERVSTEVLIGAIYVNRGSFAQEAGALEDAERLFARGEALAGDGMKRLLREQRIALLNQLATDDLTSNDPQRQERAYETLLIAADLGGEASQRNLRAATERLLAEEAATGKEAAALARAQRATAKISHSRLRSGLMAFALDCLGRARLSANDLDAALGYWQQALAEQLGPTDAPLRKTLKHNYLAALSMAAVNAARRGQLDAAERYVSQSEAISEDPAQVKRERLQVLLLVAESRLTSNDLTGAAALYRRALTLSPQEGIARQNLAAALGRQITPLVNAARCAEVAPLVEELRSLNSNDPFATEAQLNCWSRRAAQTFDAGDLDESIRLYEAAWAVAPQDPALRHNLAVALLTQVRKHAQQGRCQEAQRGAQRAGEVAAPKVGAATIKEALGPCR